MAKILWLNWSGGGNLPPSLGIAWALAQRGHDVRFAGRPEMVPRVRQAGFRAIELTRAYQQVDRYPMGKYIPRAGCYLTSPAVGEQIASIAAAEAPDLLIVDAMFPAALVEAARLDCPTVVMCHTGVFRVLARWRQMLTMLVGLRAEAGFPPLPADLETLWMSHDRLLATTLKSLDDAPGTLGNSDRIRYVGPCLAIEKHAQKAELPWAEDGVPLVLVSFSTAPEQGSVAKFQAAIDALSTLSVRAVVTVGDSIDPALLRPSANCLVLATADHDHLMRRSSLVVTHGGHGTLMRALRHGLPLLVVPGMAHDQAVNADAVQAWGVGRALPADAGADTVAASVRAVLADPAYRDAARTIAGQLHGIDGAEGAAREIEALLLPRMGGFTGAG